MSLLWDIHQQMGIRAASASAQAAGASAAEARGDVRELRQLLERALLVNEAMWSLLREKLGLTDAQLADRVMEVDLSDGRLDGRVRRGARPCGKCGKMMAQERTTCLYCGSVEVAPFGGPPVPPTGRPPGGLAR